MMLFLTKLFGLLGILLLFFILFALFFVSLAIRLHRWLLIFFFLCVSFDHAVVVLMLVPRLFMWLALREIVLFFFLFFALFDFKRRFF